MQRDDERDLISAWQSGSLPAAEAFVRQRQTEARTIAFLLTLNKGQARGLVNSAFVRFLRSARSIDPDADTRVEFLARLCRIFLRGDYEAVTDAPGDILPGGPPEKYGVDNQRDRTIAALGRLEEGERVALVLSEIAGFGPEQLNLVLERGNTALVAPIETGRQRLRHSLDIPQGQPVRSVLLDASFDGPREDLWPGLADDIAQVHREEQRRGQLITYGVVAGTILVALIAIVALFSNDLFNRDADNSSTAADTTATVDAIITPAPTPVPPTPTPTPEPLPLGNVPNLLMFNAFNVRDLDGTHTGFLSYDSEIGEVIPIEQGDDATLSGSLVRQLVSPDGRFLVFLRSEDRENVREFWIDVLDSQTLEQRWQTSVGTRPLGPEAAFHVAPPLAVSSDAVFSAHLEDGLLHVISMNIVTGEVVATASEELPEEVSRGTGHNVIRLFLTPDESQLLTLTFRDPSQGALFDNGHLVTFAIPDLDVQEDVPQPDSTVFGRFQTMSAALAVDGRTLYSTNIGERNRQVQVDFFDTVTGLHTPIVVPFSNDEHFPYRPVRQFLSNDGYRLFLIDAYNGEVAIMHLTEHRLERFFSLDVGDFGTLFGLGEGKLVMGWAGWMSISGDRLYVPAMVGTEDMRYVPDESSGVWVIDLSRWELSDFWPVDGTVREIFGEVDGDVILLRYSPDAEDDPHVFVRVGRENGQVHVQPAGEQPLGADVQIGYFSIVSTYRLQHGRSSSIEGVEPVTLASYSTLPDVRASSTNNVVSNKDATVSVRIYDPLTGNVLRAPREDVRFDPDSTITATLTLEGQPSQLLVLNEDEPGVYRANASLPADGTWNINVSIIAPDGSTRLVPQAGTVQVAPTLTGSDGERYQFRVTFDPRSPTVGEEATFRIRLVNVDSGAIVSEDVTFDVEQAVLDGGTIEDLPDRLSMSLGNPATYFGTRSIIAGETSYGIWDGRITFQDAGTWTTAIRLQFADMPLAEIPSTRVAVHAAQ